jgi:hypothetical protein
VARAQTALTEIAARATLGEPTDLADDARREELAQWNHQARTPDNERLTEQADERALER